MHLCYSVTPRLLLRPNMFMELHDLVDQLVSPQFQELRYLIHRSLHEDPEFYNLFVQTLMGQAHLAEPQYAVETMPTVYVQGVGIMSTLLDGSDPDHEKFSRTYNMPYHFSPPSFGEPYPLPSHITEGNAETTNLFLVSFLYNMITHICIIYNMSTNALPDMYARSPRAEGIHIRQSTSAHVITSVTFLALLKSAQTLIASAHSTYILKDAHCDCGILL